MTSVTFSTDQLIEWGITGYIWAHILFGLVTHYHSAMQARQFNKDKGPYDYRVTPGKIMLLFAWRMLLGLPSWLAVRMIAPVGNRWHMGPKQIARWRAPRLRSPWTKCKA